MTNHVEALREVAIADLARLNELEERLREAKGASVEAVVRSIGECCDSLSACLTRLSKHADSLRPKETADKATSEPTPSPEVRAAIKIVPMMQAIIECDKDDAEIATNKVSMNKARRQTELKVWRRAPGAALSWRAPLAGSVCLR